MSTNDQRLEYLRQVAAPNEIPVPSPYKKPQLQHAAGAPKKRGFRRHKNARQLVSEELRRINAALEASVVGEPPNERKKLRVRVSHFSVDAPPSIRPTKRYCDITGLAANYKSPTNNLRYYNAEIYQMVVKPMAPGVDQEYLKLRGANFVLK
ncbi:Ies6p KNAG_0G00440 [Huiozyma naganishii CBS 8797]|uniref:Vps72/YL1 C-terminal domain-containing protein n=1 Tax=Huiozyma naganishii (strain ATCC MYA-139 / BCRC 22969 / CBS 8797 / KCTC 17520 / NBRC 10181 / NCYC 3082 / Yp74L-3) TaxID=1071383 RepID=J7S8U1_HUIN7|nr:hypothetical protein KNAG_0G00440 [Kazachstania naganishii CBS 8797]CCK71101.1 hypothetical protein KNAG_0G00440 [Kazachstania naganishii CBS 8797]